MVRHTFPVTDVPAHGLHLPVDAVTETFGILGIKGSGKTTTGRVLVEGLHYCGQRSVIIDPLGVWWGLRAGPDGDPAGGLPFTIFGGDHADLPLDVAAGEAIADLLVELPISAVLDLSHLRKGEQRRFLTDFLERLYHTNRDPLMLVVDEADLYAPQRPVKGAERLLGAMEDTVRRGRVRGLGVTLITQRPASLHKDVLSQVSVLIAHRLVGPQDRAALDTWVSANGTREQRDAMLESLASLPTGHAWWWSPSWLDLFQRVKVRRPWTFDSSATPKVSDRHRHVQLAAVDLEQLRERLATVIQRAEEDDPVALRRRIGELEREISRYEGRLAMQPTETVRVEYVTVPDRELLERIQAMLRPSQEAAELISVQLGPLMTGVDRAISEASKALEASNGRPGPSGPGPRPDPPPSPGPTVRRPAAPAATPDQPAHLKAGARRMLAVAVRNHPRRLTRRQLATLAKMTVSGGTFGTYLGHLKAAGYLAENQGILGVTIKGLQAHGVDGWQPLDPAGYIDQWRQVLKAGAVRMLDVLVDRYPDMLTREQLAAAAGKDGEPMAASGGTFGTYLGHLRANGLAVTVAGMVKAAPQLFIDLTTTQEDFRLSDAVFAGPLGEPLSSSAG